jgi:hypothetical protein
MDPIDDHDSGQRYRDSDVLSRVILLSLAFTQVAMTSFLHWLPSPPAPLPRIRRKLHLREIRGRGEPE